MAMTNAERQAAWRQRQRERLQQAQRNVTPDAELQAEVERLRARVAELEAQAGDDAPAKPPKRPPLASRVRVRNDDSVAEVPGKVLWPILDELLREGKKNPAHIAGAVIQAQAGTLMQLFSGTDRGHAERSARGHVEFLAEKKAREMLPQAQAALEEAKARADAEFKKYAAMRKGIKAQLGREDYRYLLNVLHPDREPDKERRAKAFDLVRKLQPYIDAAD